MNDSANHGNDPMAILIELENGRDEIHQSLTEFADRLAEFEGIHANMVWRLVRQAVVAIEAIQQSDFREIVEANADMEADS